MDVNPKQVSLHERVLLALYPPQSKVSVFLMSLSMFTVAIAHPDLSGFVRDAIVHNFVLRPGRLIIATVFATFLLALLYTSMALPFSRKDLRDGLGLVVVVNAVLVTFANLSYAIASEEAFLRNFSAAGAVYGAAWLFVLAKRDGPLIEESSPAPVEALCAGAVCEGLLLFAIWGMHLSWVLAYSFAVAGAITLYSAGRSWLAGSPVQ